MGRRCWMLPVLFVFLSSGPCAGAEIEDLVDLFEAEKRIVAVVGERSVSVDLRPGERVCWRGAEGELGAVLTDARFLVLAAEGDAWQELPLRPDEAPRCTAVVSPYLALVVTGGRVVGFGAADRRFVEARFPLRDELLAVEAGERVAVVVTSTRALAFAAGADRFAELPLRARESVETVKVSASRSAVRTSEGLLSFDAAGGAWREHCLP